LPSSAPQDSIRPIIAVSRRATKTMSSATNHVPVIDVEALVQRSAGRTDAARQIGAACRAHGFFYVVNHGVDSALCERLQQLARAFFALDEPTKMRWRMALGGRAWRGYFPLGGELTSGRPDWKEGLYLGAELGNRHPLVQARTPIHGRNLFPEHPSLPGFRETVLAYIAALTQLGHRLMEGIALSLDLDADYFAERYTADPLVLFRLFNYPSRPVPAGTDALWGVGEHTDYGLLTMLWQDDVGGLEVKTREGWVAAPPLPGSFVCNIGDMLDRMTGGRYRSTPHRVDINSSGRDRLSFPFFFDPNFTVRVKPIEGLAGADDDSAARWDHANVHAFDGTYGDYLLSKVGKVFPELKQQVL
jgi:isopenicillin N synthase-like dioxygenase